jgi:prevent-host-death family protein
MVHEEPLMVQRNGKNAAVAISAALYRRLTEKAEALNRTAPKE